jgi:predicted aspartyl protease
MMQGRVKDGRASVPITFRLSNQPDFQIEFVVDTGFMDGYHLSIYFQIDGAVNLTAIS